MSEFFSGLKRFFKINFLKTFKAANNIAEKSGRKKLQIIFNMIACAVLYGMLPEDYINNKIYLAPKNKQGTYLTEKMNSKTIEKYNSKNLLSIMNNRVDFNHEYEKYTNRSWIFLDECSVDDFAKFVRTFKPCVVKSQYRNQAKTNLLTVNEDDNLYSLYKNLVEDGQTVLEEKISVVDELNTISPDTINTVRVDTFVRNGSAYILQIVLKLNSFDTNKTAFAFANTDGIITTDLRNSDGTLSQKFAVDSQVEGFKLPMINTIKSTVKEAAKLNPQLAYVSWDIAVTPKGLVFLSANPQPDLLQPDAEMLNDANGYYSTYRRYIDF